MRIQFFGTFDIASHPRVDVLMQGLRDRGHAVDVVNRPLGLDTAWRVRILRRPWLTPLLVLRLAWLWLLLILRARRLPPPDVCVVGHLAHFDVHVAKRLHPRARLVLDYLISLEDTAADRASGSPRVRSLLARVDHAALRSSDVVLVDTDESALVVPQAHRSKVTVVPVGAGASWLEAGAAPRRERAGPLRVVFFGLYTPLQGTSVIAEALRLLDGRIVVTMIGDGQDRPRARRIVAEGAGHARVRWVGWVPAAELPMVVADHDVCLGIFGTGPKAARVVPTKVYQGALAGCAVVTSETAPQRRALGSAGLYVAPGDAVALAETLVALCDDAELLARHQARARERAQHAFLPAAVVRPLDDRLAVLDTAPRQTPHAV